MMNRPISPSYPDRPSLVPALLRYILDVRRRRFVRDLQRRAEWADEARNAPTMQAWTKAFTR